MTPAEALLDAADFIEATAGIGEDVNDYTNGWYHALAYALGELRKRAGDMSIPAASEVRDA